MIDLCAHRPSRKANLCKPGERQVSSVVLHAMLSHELKEMKSLATVASGQGPP